MQISITTSPQSLETILSGDGTKLGEFLNTLGAKGGGVNGATPSIVLQADSELYFESGIDANGNAVDANATGSIKVAAGATVEIDIHESINWRTISFIAPSNTTARLQIA